MTIRTGSMGGLTVLVALAPARAQSLKDLTGAVGAVTGGSGGCRRWIRRARATSRACSNIA